MSQALRYSWKTNYFKIIMRPIDMLDLRTLCLFGLTPAIFSVTEGQRSGARTSVLTHYLVEVLQMHRFLSSSMGHKLQRHITESSTVAFTYIPNRFHTTTFSTIGLPATVKGRYPNRVA